MNEAIEHAAAVARGRAWAGTRGRRARERADLPLSTIAAICGVTVVAAFRWESGASKPRGAHAATYAELIERLEAEAEEREEAGVAPA